MLICFHYTCKVWRFQHACAAFDVEQQTTRNEVAAKVTRYIVCADPASFSCWKPRSIQFTHVGK